MATIKASWRRVIQVKQFESETYELGIEKDAEEGKGDEVQQTKDLARLLAVVGDALIVERIQAREERQAPTGSTLAVVRRPAGRQDSPPDPKIVAEVKAGKTPVVETTDPDAPDDYLNL